MRKMQIFFVSSLILVFLFTACAPKTTPTETPAGMQEITPFRPQLEGTTTQTTEVAIAETPVTETSEPSFEPIARKPKLWVDPLLPFDLSDVLDDKDDFERVEQRGEADIVVSFSRNEALSSWTYVLVAPFATVKDAVAFEELKQFWTSGEGLPIEKLAMEESTLAAMETLLGLASKPVEVMAAEALLEHCLANPEIWAIVPFQQLVPKWKVISIDGQSPISKSFDVKEYPLNVSIGVEQYDDRFDAEAETLIQILKEAIPESNYQSSKLATVIMTGVTAMVRATAKEMEIKGILYPGEDVREVMREADIAHVSNEIPFYDQCPPPQWVQSDLVFCSDPKYIDLLLDIGTDVVDLTGDHFKDYGIEAMHQTLDIYQEHQLPYFGGGRNIEEAKAPVKFEVNGNKIAFLGCNGKMAGYATASKTVPGAFHCDMDYMAETVKALKAEGYLPIVTFQHNEYYVWQPQPEMVRDFRTVAEAGAVVVSGSQGHQPHGFEFFDSSFIHYGLGNLFFDQLNIYEDTDKAFLDRYVFYDGNLISIELLTVQFLDWSKPRWTDAESREAILEKLFLHSAWQEKPENWAE